MISTQFLQWEIVLGTIKSVIVFVSDSTKRRYMVPNVPILYEAR